MNSPQMFHVIGAGVTGLSTALALAQAGHRCRVYERRDRRSFAGMGFLLMPNGFQALKTLLGDQADTLGFKVNYLTLHNYEQNTTHTMLGSGQRSMSRPLLIKTLLKSCLHEGVEISYASLEDCKILDHPHASPSPYDSAIQLHFQSTGGQTLIHTPSYVIGADGVHSTLRSTIFPDARLSDPMLTEFVGLTAHDLVLDDINLVKIHHHHDTLAFGWMPISSSHMIWYAQMKYQPQNPKEDGEIRRSFLLECYRDWPEQVLSLIQNCTFERTYRWDTQDLFPLKSCFSSGVLLIGDAAHASLPLSSQGVSAALEDAVTLAQLLKTHRLTPQKITPERWVDLCHDFERIRSPIWLTQYHEAHTLEKHFLSGQPFSTIPMVD